jgi:uncharacterized protein
MPVKPTDAEERYFALQELERRKTAEMDTRKLMAEAEKARLRELHHMKCPKCGMDLDEIDYRAIKIDKCSGCEGVWLDPGELETIATLEQSVLRRVFGVFRRPTAGEG